MAIYYFSFPVFLTYLRVETLLLSLSMVVESFAGHRSGLSAVVALFHHFKAFREEAEQFLVPWNGSAVCDPKINHLKCRQEHEGLVWALMALRPAADTVDFELVEYIREILHGG